MNDVVIIGSGPAGMSAAAELSQRGVSVICVSPSHGEDWPNTYGLWVDEIYGLELESTFDQVWNHPVAIPRDGVLHDLGRTYARLNNELLQAHLHGCAEAGGARFVSARVEAVEPTGRGSRVILKGQDAIEARLVIDAAGRHSMAIEVQKGNPGFQTAYGILVDIEGDPLAGREMVLMDFSTSHLDANPDPPSFLYAMRLDSGRYFLEETVLTGRPPVEIDLLQKRLERRLAARECRVEHVHEIERCYIPMGGPLPEIPQRNIAFGAAAGFVHPATGYQMARMLRSAPPLADAIARGLGQGDSAEDVAGRAWNAIWPRERRVARELYLFGMETLLRLDAPQTRQFFDVFFQLPRERWQGFLSDTLAPAEIASTMWTLFRHVGVDLKSELMISGMGPGARHLLRALRRSL